MTVDFERRATAAEELASRPDRARLAELRRYLGAVTGEVVSDHHVEDAHVWPALIELAGDDGALAPLTADHGAPRPADRARRPAGPGRPPGLTTRRHPPPGRTPPRPPHHRRRARSLPRHRPWAVSHATAEERRAVLAGAPWPLRVLLALFEPRFHRRQQRLFRTGGLSRGTVTRGAAFMLHSARWRHRSPIRRGRSAAAVESLQIGQLHVGPLPSHAPELGRESAPAHQ